MVDLKTVKVGQKLYCAQINECCEGWESTSFHKTKITAIEEDHSGIVIKLDNGVGNVYLNKDSTHQYHNFTFFKTKREILNYISSNILI